MRKTHDVFVTLGATNHSEGEREKHDYYATHPSATEWLCKIETFNKNILEPCCGEGHISKVLEENGYNVTSTDLIDRGYGIGGVDFFKREEVFDGDIVTNPPYRNADKFVEKALELVPNGNKVCLFLKLQFLEGKQRRKLFEKAPPCTVWVTSSRLSCAKNGDFDGYSSNAIAFAWFVWEKGYKGDTIVKWFN